MARSSKRGAPKATKAVTEATKAVTEDTEAPQASEVPPERRMSSRERKDVAVSVLDLALRAVERRLREEPDSLRASGISEVTRLLTMFYKHADLLDDGAEARAEHEAMLASLGPMAFPDDADDADDPLLQGDRDLPQEPTVTPAEIASLADFTDD